VLPVICSKLLRNESIFRSYIDSIGLLKSRREEDKFVDQADLR
jgi:ribosomal protein L21E